jgi:hypothetical protein
MYFFHYRSRAAAQMIIASGEIHPGRHGVYLCDELYGSGASAAAALGIPVVGPVIRLSGQAVQLTKAVEVVCCIPEQLLDMTKLSPLEVAQPFLEGRTNRTIYPGGGRQFRYSRQIPLADCQCLQLSSP